MEANFNARMGVAFHQNGSITFHYTVCGYLINSFPGIAMEKMIALMALMNWMRMVKLASKKPTALKEQFAATIPKNAFPSSMLAMEIMVFYC
jgi:hypothetical protein